MNVSSGSALKLANNELLTAAGKIYNVTNKYFHTLAKWSLGLQGG